MMGLFAFLWQIIPGTAIKGGSAPSVVQPQSYAGNEGPRVPACLYFLQMEAQQIELKTPPQHYDTGQW